MTATPPFFFVSIAKRMQHYKICVAHWRDRRPPTGKLLPTLDKPKGTHSYTSIPDEREVGISDPKVAEQVPVGIMF
jgi:hypothetical protein